MTDYLSYIFQVSICFSLLYCVFYLFFRKLTFHKINRILLLSILLFSLLIPSVNSIVPEVMTTSFHGIPNFDEFELYNQNNIASSEFEGTLENNNIMLDSLYLIYWLGFFFCTVRLIISLSKLFFLKRKSSVIFNEKYQLIVAEVPTVFSVFRWIFVPKNEKNKWNQSVIEHEKAHVRMLHSIDLVITELYMIVFWINPFIYFFRNSIRSVHEFQADSAVLNSEVKKSFYLETLLNNLGVSNTDRLYSYFNYPIMKKRIDMITKTNSKKMKSIYYLIFAPMLIILFMAFTKNDYIPDEFPVETFSEWELADPPSIFPLSNGSVKLITHKYGIAYKQPKSKKEVIHGGIDIRAKQGTPIVATADGTITSAKLTGNWGNLIIITHADGYTTYYAHLKDIKVKEGQIVKQGEFIGTTGNTGLSTGPHLHYEVRQYGKRLNPMKFLEK